MSKIVLVTGASRGIGLEAAKHFSKEGYKVIGTSRGDFNLGKLIGNESAISVQLDLTSKESIKNLFVDLKSEDLLPSVLVNNAGITKDQLFLRMKDEDWDEEEFYEVSEEDEEHLIGDANDSDALDVDAPDTTVAVESPNPEPTLDDALRQELATKAGQVGVMQAAPGSQQGETGWYVDASTELQYWNVGPDGSWTRVQ